MKRVVRTLLAMGVASALHACGPSDEALFHDTAHSGAGGAPANGGSNTNGGNTPGTGESSGVDDASGGTDDGLATGGARAMGGASNSAGERASGGNNASRGGTGTSERGGAAQSGGRDGAGGAMSGGAGSSGAGTSGAGAEGPVGGAGGGSMAEGGTAGDGSGGSVSGPTLVSGSKAVDRFLDGPHCEDVSFPSAFSVPSAEIRVQASVLHPDSDRTHDAVSVWVESITQDGFEVCLAEDPDLTSAHMATRVDWLAYVDVGLGVDGASSGRAELTGEEGSACQTILFASAFASAPQVQLTANHQGSSANEGEPVAVWVEQVSSEGLRFCAQEVEGTDGRLDGVNVDWLAYTDAMAGSGFHAGEVEFGSFSGIECRDISTGCSDCDNVQLSINHRRADEDASYVHEPTLVWGEDRGDGMMSVCVTEIDGSNGDHDEHLSVDWLARAPQ